MNKGCIYVHNRIYVIVVPVDCSLPSNTLHLACTNHLQDPPLEQDHLSDYTDHLTSENTG